MQFNELDESMQQIILECQDDFIRDGKERLAMIESEISKWRAQSISAFKLSDTFFKQIHSMKGVARTIYFEDFHELCEEIGTWIRSHTEEDWNNSLANQLLTRYELLTISFAACEKQVNDRT